MKSKESHTSSLNHPESVVSRFCTAFLEAGWIAAAVLSALFMNIYTKRIFEADKAALIRSIAILMFVAWLIKTIEYRVLAKFKSSKPTVPEQTTRSKYSWFKYVIFLPAGLYFLSYLISCLTSVLPTSSFWGSYEHTLGLYTTISFFFIFLVAATHIRTQAQIERLITAIILTSIPIMVYGLMQKSGVDPFPWRTTSSAKRIFSTMGNPIFFAAYLILVVPLILARLLNLLKYHPNIKFRRFKLVFYTLLLLLQIISIVLTQSRGPLLGLLSSLAFFFLIYAIIYKKKGLIWGLISGFTGAVIFVVLFNLPNTPLEPLKKVPYLERLGRLNPSEGSARVRLILWGNALKLMREAYKPILPHSELIDAQPWRILLGYGPETLGNIFYRYHTAELVDYEGRTVFSNHCHNSILQVLVTQGILGLVAFLCLIVGAVYLGLTIIKRLILYEGGSGLLLVILGIISAIIAHFIETLFGLGLVVTYMHFWLFLALLHALARFVQTLHESFVANNPPPLDLPKAGSARPTKVTFLVTSVFWTYLVISVVITVVMITEYFPSYDTNIEAWIIGAYLWILLGILLGTISLYFNMPQRTKVSAVSLAFNVVGYLCLIIVAFFLIVYSNFNPILADGYYKKSYSNNRELKRIWQRYEQAEDFRGRLHQKKRKIGLSAAEEKQLQSTIKQIQGMLSQMLILRLNNITYYQRGLRLAPNEKVYLTGMGRNFLGLAKIWLAIKDTVLAIRDASKASGATDMNTPGCLRGPPSIKEIIDFPADQYHKFNQYDFLYCYLATIRRAYEIEPTNYECRIVLAQVYRNWAVMTRRDGKAQKSDEYFKKAMEYYQKAKESSPGHPVVNEHIKAIQREMGRKD